MATAAAWPRRPSPTPRRWPGTDVQRPTHPAARVYAAALAQLGAETKTLGVIWSDLQALHDLFDAEPWFRQFFSSPKIDRPTKWAAVEKAFKGRVSRETLGLMKVLVMKGREDAFR